jgi:hypothetical protein
MRSTPSAPMTDVLTSPETMTYRSCAGPRGGRPCRTGRVCSDIARHGATFIGPFSHGGPGDHVVPMPIAASRTSTAAGPAHVPSEGACSFRALHFDSPIPSAGLEIPHHRRHSQFFVSTFGHPASINGTSVPASVTQRRHGAWTQVEVAARSMRSSRRWLRAACAKSGPSWVPSSRSVRIRS